LSRIVRKSLKSQQVRYFNYVRKMYIYFSASVRGLLRIDTALEALSDEKFFALACTGPRYSESTLKKHIWVIKLYQAFSERSGIVPFPLDARHAAWFIRMIGLEADYAVGSIEDVIIPSLKRIHREMTGMDTSAEINASLAQALKDIKKALRNDAMQLEKSRQSLTTSKGSLV